jgi:hypothetical protein
MVSVGSTDTYNLLPTDTKNCFCSSDRSIVNNIVWAKLLWVCTT